jgi:hypothetical protein
MTAGDPRVTIHDGDANDAIRKLCGEIDWGRTRGVIFLDPFGASLEAPCQPCLPPRLRSAAPGHPPKSAEMLARECGTWFDMYPGRAAT